MARLFEDAWSLVSQDLGTLNEQDCLNRLLIASQLRWAPLPPALFPNGYVYFRRPLPPSAQAHGGPVLIHANWINGIVAKRYLLREARVWLADEGRAGAATPAAVPRPNGSASGGGDGGRYLAYVVPAGGRSLVEQMAALRGALALSRIANRSLILSPFYATDRPAGAGADEGDGDDGVATSSVAAAGVAAGARRCFTILLRVRTLRARLANHRESSLLTTRWGGGGGGGSRPSVQPLPEGSANGVAEAALAPWLRAREREAPLVVSGLHRAAVHFRDARSPPRSTRSSRRRCGRRPSSARSRRTSCRRFVSTSTRGGGATPRRRAPSATRSTA